MAYDKTSAAARLGMAPEEVLDLKSGPLGDLVTTGDRVTYLIGKDDEVTCRNREIQNFPCVVDPNEAFDAVFDEDGHDARVAEFDKAIAAAKAEGKAEALAELKAKK